MNERRIMLQISALFVVFAIVCGFVFVVTNYSLIWMVATAVWLVGAFMAFAVSFIE